jgi:RNA polymerase sigma-70 factor (ECF subfamily)
METAHDRRPDDFTQTRWSMVQRLGAPQSGKARQALTELALRYWYPVYAYVRRCGHAPEIAQDITRAFFQRMAIEAGTAGGFPGGRFRDWLLTKLNVFLAGDWHELMEGEAHAGSPPLDDLERRHRDDQANGDSPAQAFQRGFALEVLARGFKALQVEAGQTGHLDMYEMLEPYLARDPLPGQYEEMGRHLGVRPVALVLALKRLRQRFRELVREELADAVASPEDLAAEQQALFAALARSG